MTDHQRSELPPARRLIAGVWFKDAVRQQYQAGKMVEQISAECGVSPVKIRRIIQEKRND